jgi:hypothetical protein
MTRVHSVSDMVWSQLRRVPNGFRLSDYEAKLGEWKATTPARAI